MAAVTAKTGTDADTDATTDATTYLGAKGYTIYKECLEPAELSTLKELDSEVYPGGLPFKSSKISASE